MILRMIARMTKTQTMAFGAALISCMFWAGNFVMARGVHEWVMPFTLSFWRWLVALIVLLPYGMPHVIKQFPIIRQHWKYFICMGFISVCAFNSLIYTAAHYTTTHHITLISATSPIWTLVIAGVIGLERMSRYKIGGAACALLGALVIICNGDIWSIGALEWNKGDLIIVVSAVIWAVYSVGLQYKPKGISMRCQLTSFIIVGLVFLVPCYSWELWRGYDTPFNMKAWIAYLYVGIFGSVVAWFLWNYAIQTIGSVKSGLVYYTIPAFSAVLAVILLGEPLEPYHFYGFALVVAGIIISNLRKLGIVRR